MFRFFYSFSSPFLKNYIHDGSYSTEGRHEYFFFWIVFESGLLVSYISLRLWYLIALAVNWIGLTTSCMVVQEFQPLGAIGKSYSTPTQDNSILSTSSQSSSICFIVMQSTYDWMFLVPCCLNFMKFLEWTVSDKTLFLHVFWMVTDSQVKSVEVLWEDNRTQSGALV